MVQNLNLIPNVLEFKFQNWITSNYTNILSSNNTRRCNCGVGQEVVVRWVSLAQTAVVWSPNHHGPEWDWNEAETEILYAIKGIVKSIKREKKYINQNEMAFNVTMVIKILTLPLQSLNNIKFLLRSLLNNIILLV